MALHFSRRDSRGTHRGTPDAGDDAAQRTVIGLFGSVAEAALVVQDAIALGVPCGGIGLVAAADAGATRPAGRSAGGDYDYGEHREDRWAGLARQLPDGVRFLVVPGLGQVVAAGPEATGLVVSGASPGGEDGAGGLAGRLVLLGMGAVEARRFVSGVRRGLLLLLLPAGDAAEAAGILPGLIAALFRHDAVNAGRGTAGGGSLHAGAVPWLDSLPITVRHGAPAEAAPGAARGWGRSVRHVRSAEDRSTQRHTAPGALHRVAAASGHEEERGTA